MRVSHVLDLCRVTTTEPVQLYDTTYRTFELDARRRVRLETYGDDIGQNSWLTTDEWRTAVDTLGLRPGWSVLDVGLWLGRSGHPPRPHNRRPRRRRRRQRPRDRYGERACAREGLAALARFVQADAGRPLPFDDGTFDAVVCVDAVNHLPNRPAVLRDWHRLLKPRGRILFTDPIVITGILSSEEIAVRSSIGFFIFTVRNENERLIREAGFDLVRAEDTTDNVVAVARRWHDARARHRDALVGDEGEETFEGLQRFLAVVHALADERRLSRHTFLATRTPT